MNPKLPMGTGPWPVRRKQYRLIFAAFAALVTGCIHTAIADSAPPHGIVAATIGVQQLGFENPPANVIVTNQYTIGDFRVRSTANKGDYDVQIGDNLNDDVDGGVLITSIAENGGRDNLDQFGASDPVYPGINTATAHIDYGRTGATAGGYFIPVAMTYPNSAGTTVVEYNLNVAAGWFPYDKWIGAFIRNSGTTNGGVNNLISGSPQLVLGTHFIDLGSGRSTVDLRTLGIDSQKDGVLLVVGAKNEDNYALSQANTNGTWSVFSKDNGTDAASYEQDPIAFVYIPKTNVTVVSGRFRADSTIDIAGGNFTITGVSEGQWELKIPGRNPDNGVLLVSPEGGLTQNRDNIVTAAPNTARDGWIIESRDLPNGVPPGETMPFLETPGVEPVASFVFIPGPSAGFAVSQTNNLFTTENAGTTTFTVRLDTRPKAGVTINLSSSTTTEGTVSPATLTFTPDNWDVEQTVTVTGVDDATTDGPSTFSIAFSPATSTDPDYTGRLAATVTVINLDNEGGITVNPTSGLTTSESGTTATFTVRLEQAPQADVVIALTSSNPAEGTVSPASLTFTTANWSQDQTVTVTGVNESFDDGDASFTIVTAAAVSSDNFYSGRNPADVSVKNLDDDTAAVVVTPTSGLQVVEPGGQATYTITLGSRPTADVVIKPILSTSSEATVSPTTFTFTTANWEVPAVFTITAVDDLIADGNIGYTITNSLTSTDPLYAALKPANVTAVTLDNEASLTLFKEDVLYGLGQPAVGIAGRTVFLDTNTVVFTGTTIIVSLGNTVTQEDQFAIRDFGTGEGQIGVSGQNISFSGAVIGTFSGGINGLPLTITLTGSATPEGVEALVHAITYRNTNAQAPIGSRKAQLTVKHPDGGLTTGTINIRVGLLRVANFQEGTDFGYGIYTGAHDIELNELRPDTAFPTGRGASGMLLDWRDADTPNAGNILLRFDDMVGNGPGQIPTNAIIVSADLFLHINDTGDGSPLYRMLQPWDDQNETWNTIGGGITPDGIRTRLDYDSQIGVEDGSGATTTGTVWVSVTPDVQAWVSGGETNYGWAMPAWPLRLDGTAISSSEATILSDRPRLRVFWLPTNTVSIASFRQGVDDYAGAVDTRLRQVSPDSDFSGTGTVFVDAIVSGTDPNPEQVLLRFDTIIGTEPGQVPTGSFVHAAILDLASLNGDAMGDGGVFFPLLQPWPEPATWNTWVDGIQTNGVEAASVPSASAGFPELNPDVQGGFLSFDLTRDVQSWVSNSSTNFGWVIVPWPNGGNGWGFFTSENGTERNRPRLRVFYSPPAPQSDLRLSATVVGGEVRLTFNGEAGKGYTLLRAADVTGPWENLKNVSPSANGPTTIADTAPLPTRAFYRVTSP